MESISAPARLIFTQPHTLIIKLFKGTIFTKNHIIRISRIQVESLELAKPKNSFIICLFLLLNTHLRFKGYAKTTPATQPMVLIIKFCKSWVGSKNNLATKHAPQDTMVVNTPTIKYIIISRYFSNFIFYRNICLFTTLLINFLYIRNSSVDNHNFNNCFFVNFCINFIFNKNNFHKIHSRNFSKLYLLVNFYFFSIYNFNK